MQNPLPFNSIEELGEAFPSALVVMLYDEAIANLEIAVEAIEKGEIEARFEATARVADIISQLYLALDLEQGGEIAENLGGIYNFILTQLPRVNFHDDVDMARQAIGLLQPVRDSWFELDERIRGEVIDAETAETAANAANADDTNGDLADAVIAQAVRTAKLSM